MVAAVDVRVVEYEILLWSDLYRMGDLVAHIGDSLEVGSALGILRCVTGNGRQVTYVGSADATEKLVKSGVASQPDGIAIPRKIFPVMLEGWPYRLRDT